MSVIRIMLKGEKSKRVWLEERQSGVYVFQEKKDVKSMEQDNKENTFKYLVRIHDSKNLGNKFQLKVLQF